MKSYFVKTVFLDGRISFWKSRTESGAKAIAAVCEREKIPLGIQSVQWGIE